MSKPFAYIKKRLVPYHQDTMYDTEYWVESTESEEFPLGGPFYYYKDAQKLLRWINKTANQWRKKANEATRRPHA